VAGEVGIKIKVSAKDANRNLDKLKNSSNRLQESFSKLQNRSNAAANNIRKTGKASKLASNGVNALNRAVRNLVLGFGAIQAFRFVVFKGAELETQRKSLEVLTGSISKTNKIIKQLQDFGAVTPFRSTDLIETAKRLKAFGFETDEIVGTVKRLSDVAGATGANLNEIALVFGQIRAKGKLMREEELQLLERGIDITSELKRITGLQGDAFETAMRKGEIGADKVAIALENLTSVGGTYADGAIAQSTTLAGKFSTLVDNVETLARTIEDFLEPVLKGILDTANKALSAINKLLSSEFQRGLSIRRGALIAPGGTKGDFESLTKYIQGISPAGLDAGSLTEIMNQIRGTQDQAADVAANINKSRPFGITSGENQAFTDFTIASQTKINELLAARQKLLNQNLTVSKDKNNELNKRIQKGFTLNEGAKQLNQTLEKQKQTQQQITNILASGMTNAVMGLIEGTKTLGQALADIAKQLASMFLNKAFSSIFGGMFGGGGGGGGSSFLIPSTPLVPYVPGLGGAGFAQGGYVNSPTMGLVGEAGESEYIIPSSKMDGAMSRYSAGARGGSVIPGGSGSSGTVAGGSGNTVVEYTGPTLNFNGDEYVPKSAVPEIIGAATKQGAMAGKAQTMNTLRNSRSQRASLGL
jgi:tape measure domain-containing protein